MESDLKKRLQCVVLVDLLIVASYSSSSYNAPHAQPARQGEQPSDCGMRRRSAAVSSRVVQVCNAFDAAGGTAICDHY
jgi:hypothetical protein